MEIAKSDKISILFETLKQRYHEVEELRRSAFQIATWTIGAFLILAGWIVQGGQTMTIFQKILLSLAIGFASGATLLFLKDMERGFRRQFEVINKIQVLLGLYKTGYFQANESVLSQDWMQRPSGGFFRFVRFLLFSTSLIIIAFIFLSGVVF